MAIPYLDTLIANINSHFSGEVVELVVSASAFNPTFLSDDETLRSELMVTLSCQSWLISMEKKTEVMFEGVTYSSFDIINKEELLGEW